MTLDWLDVFLQGPESITFVSPSVSTMSIGSWTPGQMNECTEQQHDEHNGSPWHQRDVLMVCPHHQTSTLFFCRLEKRVECGSWRQPRNGAGWEPAKHRLWLCQVCLTIGLLDLFLRHLSNIELAKHPGVRSEWSGGHWHYKTCMDALGAAAASTRGALPTYNTVVATPMHINILHV